MPALSQKKKSEGGVQAVTLALQIIEALAFADRPQGVTELAKNLGTSKTRIFNYLQTLAEHGYAVQEPDTERYRVGVRVSQIGGAVANEFNLLSLSREPMRRVHQAIGHTTVLSKFDGSTLFTAAQIEGTSLLRISVRIGFVLGLHSSAQGKVVLAFGPAHLLEETIAKGLTAATKATITDPDKLRRDIKAIRARGWAFTASETRVGVNALAVPIRDRTHQLVASLSIMAAADDLPPRMIEQTLPHLQEAAVEISAGLSARL